MKLFYKTFLLLVLNFSFLIFNSFSQQAPGIEWAKCYGGTGQDISYEVHQTEDGGFIVAGTSSSNDGDVNDNNGSSDYWIIKIDSNGIIQWQKCFGGSNYETAKCIRKTNDNGYVVAGFTWSNDSDVTGLHGNRDYWIIKFDTVGNLIWQKCYGGTSVDEAYNIETTDDYGFLVSGITQSIDGDVTGNHGQSDLWIIKLDSLGDLQWQKCLGGSNAEFYSYGLQIADGGYLIAGETGSNDGDVNGNHGGGDLWLAKLDSTGVIQWQKCYGGTHDEGAKAIQQTLGDGIVVLGVTISNNGDVSGNHDTTATWPDIWIVKLDSAGDLQWQKCLGGSSVEASNGLNKTDDGGYIIVGSTKSDDGNVSGNHNAAGSGSPSDVWIVKIDSLGNVIWQKCLGGSGNDYGESVKQTNDKGYIISGGTNSIDGDVSGFHGIAGGPIDSWIIKLLPDTITSTFSIQHSASIIQISPNPSSGIFQITFPSSSNQKTTYTLEIISTLGQKVFEKQLQTPNSKLQTNLDISFLPKGIYVLIINGGVSALSRKFVIE